MFSWNVEEQKLLNLSDEELKSIVRNTDIQDMIEWLDGKYQGTASRIIKMFEQWKKDSTNLPKDDWGSVKTVSLKAWVKRNNYEDIVFTYYSYGKIHFCCKDIQDMIYRPFPERYLQYGRVAERIGAETFNDIIEEWFYNILRGYRAKEQQWFNKHDPYEVAKTQFLEMREQYGHLGNNHITYCSDGTVSVYGADENFEDRHTITMEELTTYLIIYGEYSLKRDALDKEYNDRLKLRDL